jgi:hypothetical protein
MKESLSSKTVKEDLASLKAFAEDISKQVCNHCSGWGHYSMDIRPSKKNIYKSKIRQCKTGEAIDMVAGFCGVDLAAFKAAMGTEKAKP